MRDGGQVLIWRWTGRTHHDASQCRVALRCALHELRIPDETIGEAVMAAWELTANALEHAHGPYEMRLIRKRSSFIFEIQDSNSFLPAMPSSHNGGAKTLMELPERGRGLQIVEAFARGRWGFRPSGGGAKVAWMEILTASGGAGVAKR
ncbi:ATP-binding protein [Streptomyces luomodiensis]|uniref:ATP-binding protein n=1 Tax=Streptomyces luomodiensis TaxID=3026192 RepID=UPI003D780AD1